MIEINEASNPDGFLIKSDWHRKDAAYPSGVRLALLPLCIRRNYLEGHLSFSGIIRRFND
jgi:hypothetical protein